MNLPIVQIVGLAGSILCLAVQCWGKASAQEPGVDFYRGKQITLVVGNAPGAEYDLGARLLARHMSRHIPGNPSIIVQNLQGAAGIVAANYMYSIAPKDGTVFASVSRNVPLQAVIGRKNLKADPRRFGWIGGSGLPSRVCYARVDSPVTSAKDLFSKELIVAGAGAGSSLSFLPLALNKILGMKFKLVEGYKGTAAAILAVQKKEVDGACHSYGPLLTTHASLLQKREIRLLLRGEEAALPAAPDLPSVYDFVTSDRDRQVLRLLLSSVELGRPYFLPPGVPPERLIVLRKAFAATLSDPALIAEADRIKTDMQFRPPEVIETVINRYYATPGDLIALTEKMGLTPGD